MGFTAILVRRALPTLVSLLTFVSLGSAETASRSKNPLDLACDSSIDRTAATLALSRHRRELQARALTSIHEATTDDRGHIAVLQDDGTILTQPNRFDLSNRAITFTPSGGAYSLAVTSDGFDGGAGSPTAVTLEDDDTAVFDLPFPFTFFGVSYSSVFLNTDGNLTFTVFDIDSTARNLARIVAGPPRIAPLFADLNPVSPASITIEVLPDRVLFTWNEVGEFATGGGSTGRNSFQVALRSNGVIRLAYRGIDASDSVVAIAPGRSDAPIQVADYSAETGGTTVTGVLAEVFAASQDLDLTAVGKAFYQTHSDEYDGLVVFTDFPLEMDDSFAFALPLRNNIRGIITQGRQTYDFGAPFGSPGRLAVFVNMGNIARYPANPYQRFLGSNHSLSILGQEFGHRWLAFLDTSDALMLGRDNSHWSFLNNSSASVMEGNEIADLGNGMFRTTRANERYSPLDQYAMGLRPASEVPPWFVVRNPQLTSLPFGFTSVCNISNLPSCGPFVGVEFSGQRRDVTIDEIIGRAGPRSPDFSQAPKDFRIGFILVTERGRAPRASSLEFLETLRTEWMTFFNQAVDGRGTMHTDLLPMATSDLQLNLAAGGSRRQETAGSSPFTQVGYAALESAFGVSVFRSLSGGDIRSEAAVPAATTGTTVTVYVERGDRVSTGLAIVNTGSVDANITLQLSNNQQTAFTLPARNQQTKFIHELLPDMGAAFAGSATLRSNVPIGVVALRGTVNQANDFIMTTVPLTEGSTATDVVAFPQIADGEGFVTELLLLNPTAAIVTGSVEFSFEVDTDRGRAARFSYEIAAGGTWQLRTSGLGAPVRTGYAILAPASGPAPQSTLVLSQFAGANLKFAAGLPGARPMTRGITPGIWTASRRTAFAVVNRNSSQANIRFTVRDPDGLPITSADFAVEGNGHRPAFLDELVPQLPQGFEGTVAFEASQPVHLITLGSLINASGQFMMTSMPIVDPAQPPPSISYFPQLVDGGNFAMEYLILNPTAANARLRFFNTMGQPLPIVVR